MTEYYKLENILNTAARKQLWHNDILADGAAYVFRAYNKYHGRRPTKQLQAVGRKTSDYREALMQKFETDDKFCKDAFWTNGLVDVGSPAYQFFQNPERVLSSKNGALTRSCYVKVPIENPTDNNQGGNNPILTETSTPNPPKVDHTFNPHDSQDPSDIINQLQNNVLPPETNEEDPIEPPKSFAQPTQDDNQNDTSSQLAKMQC